MNYHMIRTDDMLNGDGLRVIIFLSGCTHFCKGCHNPETWDVNSGKKYSSEAKKEIFEELRKDYISGITLSGGDPLHEENLKDVYELLESVNIQFPDKSIWLYTGYTWDQIFSENENEINTMRKRIVSLCDVICDGKFVKSLADVNCPWVGSTNQRVIDVKNSLIENRIVYWKK